MPWSTSRGRKRLMLLMRLMWNLHFSYNALTWLSLVFPLSMNTLRFLTDALGFTSASPTLIQNSPYLARLCFDWTKIYSVLDGFNLSLFTNIHALTSAMPFSIWEIVWMDQRKHGFANCQQIYDIVLYVFSEWPQSRLCIDWIVRDPEQILAEYHTATWSI